jgi:hypothetical protein
VLQQNAGAKHKGKFSRLQYAHNPNGKGNSWPGLRGKLPVQADTMYYKDLIGNISTSKVESSRSHVRTGFNAR